MFCALSSLQPCSGLFSLLEYMSKAKWSCSMCPCNCPSTRHLLFEASTQPSSSAKNCIKVHNVSERYCSQAEFSLQNPNTLAHKVDLGVIGKHLAAPTTFSKVGFANFHSFLCKSPFSRQGDKQLVGTVLRSCLWIWEENGLAELVASQITDAMHHFASQRHPACVKSTKCLIHVQSGSHFHHCWLSSAGSKIGASEKTMISFGRCCRALSLQF